MHFHGGIFTDNDIGTDYKVKNTGTLGGGIINSLHVIDKERWFHSFSDYPNVKNNKLFCYPYSFLRVSNNAGAYNDYHIEDFGVFDDELPNNIYFRIEALACEGCSGSLYPVEYRGELNALDNSVTLGKYPMFSWSSDAFTNWLTQNGINLAVNTISGVTAGVVSGANSLVSPTPIGVATGLINGTMSIAGTIANSFGAIRSASFMSNTAEGNVNSGDRNFMQNHLRFKFIRLRAKKEYLESLDNYFTKFGYKINRLKVPNITGRRYWNYVEIGKAEEIGHGVIPSSDLENINNAFRKGVTIWHNHSNIGNYNLNNEII